MMLAEAGAKVSIVKGIHNKTLARDENLIAEGSFNWLSAVRIAGADHQREERTMVVEGDSVAEMIERELAGLLSQEVSRTSPPSILKIWRGSTGLWLAAVSACGISLANITSSPVWGWPSLIFSLWAMFYMFKGVTKIVPVKEGFIDWVLDGGGETVCLAGGDEEETGKLVKQADYVNYVTTIGYGLGTSRRDEM